MTGARAKGADEGRFHPPRKRSRKHRPGPPGGMVDAADLKSVARKGVGVQVPRWAGREIRNWREIVFLLQRREKTAKLP
jgi:hypothetical protein